MELAKAWRQDRVLRHLQVREGGAAHRGLQQDRSGNQHRLPCYPLVRCAIPLDTFQLHLSYWCLAGCTEDQLDPTSKQRNSPHTW